jgi:uncharacterized protein YqfA (UPF0365 family)
MGFFIAAKMGGVKISFGQMIGMRIRKAPIGKIINALIIIDKENLGIQLRDLEAHTFAGGDIDNVILGLINAKRKGVNLSFREACSEDFNGVNLIEKYSDS